jgi:hypothetical protein
MGYGNIAAFEAQSPQAQYGRFQPTRRYTQWYIKPIHLEAVECGVVDRRRESIVNAVAYYTYYLRLSVYTHFTPPGLQVWAGGF